MDRLWTPWRYKYIQEASAPSSDCVFCRIRDAADDSAHFVLHRGSTCLALLNLYPYTNGHLIIATMRHVADLVAATHAELQELFLLAQRSQLALANVYNPDGFNLGMNLGACAGAGVEGHLHLHVLPRWKGDFSFMSVTAETRVLPETLAQTYKKLLPHFRRAAASS